MKYEDFFRTATGYSPFPYQEELARNPWPDLVDVPTGLGKTAAVALAWAHKLTQDPQAFRRLVWCLPMRVLVEQTVEVLDGWFANVQSVFADAGLPTPRVATLMGGNVDTDWRTTPEVPTVLVGTQDMLLSRALMRGYAMSRYAWPMDFAWLHNDALWVFDETQAMGVGVETSAQLQAFRDKFGTARPTHSIWMSATLGEQQLKTVDHPFDDPRRFKLSATDFALPRVRQRVDAQKQLICANTTLVGKGEKYAETLAAEVLEAHVEGTLTIVIVNRVSRAQELYQVLLKQGRTTDDCGLIHSRFRKPDRERQMRILAKEGDRIVVSTQVIEAGVDISATTMFSELSEWASTVQRFGRCNRYGESTNARVFWVDVQSTDEKDDLNLPYTFADLQTAREGLLTSPSANPSDLTKFQYVPPSVIRPVVRRRDMLELFDTSADIAGDDLDVSRFVRDESDPDVFLYWRDLQGERPTAEQSAPDDAELCRVTLAAASKLKTTLWAFDVLDDRWRRAGNRIVPGQTYLVDVKDGGYTDDIGFTGKPVPKGSALSPVDSRQSDKLESNDDEPKSQNRSWLTLAEHTDHVVVETRALTMAINEPDSTWLERAARWHDLGKAHSVFQDFLLSSGEPPHEGVWAKSANKASKPFGRKHFRHELASMLAYRQAYPDDPRGAFVILAHHGRVRLSLRALPDEKTPPNGRTGFARGVWDGDELPAADLGEGTTTPSFNLDLSLTQLGSGSWTQTCLDLREEFGIFRLAWWEALLRTADQRASAKEVNHE